MENQTKPISEETGKRLVELLAKAPTTTINKSVELAKKPVFVIRQNQIIAGVIGTMGLIIFALGVENLIGSIPELSSPLIEISLGLVLLVISGLFLKKLF